MKLAAELPPYQPLQTVPEPCIPKQIPPVPALILPAVVVVGMDHQFIYLNDPGAPIGAIQVPLGDFDLAWFEQGERDAVLNL